jgi:hypothetical protein
MKARSVLSRLASPIDLLFRTRPLHPNMADEAGAHFLTPFLAFRKESEEFLKDSPDFHDIVSRDQKQRTE